MAMKTQGTQLYGINPNDDSLITVGCVTAMSGLTTPRETIETTCITDTDRTFIAGIGSPGSFTYEINWDSADTTHTLLHQLKEAGDTIKWAIGLSDGTTAPTVDSVGDFVLPTTRSWFNFSGFQTDFPFDFPLNDVIGSSVSVQVSGAITHTAKV